MLTIRPLCFLGVALALSVFACSPAVYEPELLPLPSDAAVYSPIDRYDDMQIPADNPMSVEKVALGRQLYYDDRLSGDGSRSCYSCHVCESGLTDGLPTAIGAFEKPLSRSSPTLWNIGYHQNWYWDGRASTLESQAFKAWTGGNMGAKDTVPVLAAVNAEPGYAQQFTDVFGGPADNDNVPQALAAYMRTIISDDTAFDRFQKGDEGAMDAAAQRGWETFQTWGCAECHSGVLLTDLQFHNVGIGLDAAEPDVGRFKVTNLPQDMAAFKTPTLRDITQSGPYFHNGSVDSLEQAVRQMAAGGLANPNLSDKIKKNEVSDEQVADVLAFFEALEQPCGMTAPELPGR
jgi:cytochrome c peroxidase